LSCGRCTISGFFSSFFFCWYGIETNLLGGFRVGDNSEVL
jgi:hypothetical protein